MRFGHTSCRPIPKRRSGRRELKTGSECDAPFRFHFRVRLLGSPMLLSSVPPSTVICKSKSSPWLESVRSDRGPPLVLVFFFFRSEFSVGAGLYQRARESRSLRRSSVSERSG